MKTSNYNSLFAALFAVLFVLAGCASQKAPAQQAIASAESAIQTIAADAQKYLPERYAELTSSLAAAKASFDKGDYKAVLAAAPDLMTKIKSAGEDALTKKDQVMSALKGDWASLASSVPSMVAAIENRVGILSLAKKLPANVSSQALEGARTGLDGMKQMWAQASSAFAAGDLESAVNTAKTVQAKGNEVLGALGMTS